MKNFEDFFLYSCRQGQYSILTSLYLSKNSLMKLMERFISLSPAPDFAREKLGGGGKIFQIEKTMLNYKCKSHRGRFPENMTDSLSFIEFEGRITRVFACVIPNKQRLYRLLRFKCLVAVGSTPTSMRRIAIYVILILIMAQYAINMNS